MAGCFRRGGSGGPEAGRLAASAAAGPRVACRSSGAASSESHISEKRSTTSREMSAFSCSSSPISDDAQRVLTNVGNSSGTAATQWSALSSW